MPLLILIPAAQLVQVNVDRLQDVLEHILPVRSLVPIPLPRLASLPQRSRHVRRIAPMPPRPALCSARMKVELKSRTKNSHAPLCLHGPLWSRVRMPSSRASATSHSSPQSPTTSSPISARMALYGRVESQSSIWRSHATLLREKVGMAHYPLSATERFLPLFGLDVANVKGRESAVDGLRKRLVRARAAGSIRRRKRLLTRRTSMSSQKERKGRKACVTTAEGGNANVTAGVKTVSTFGEDVRRLERRATVNER